MFQNWRVLFTFNRNIRLFLLVWALIAFAYFGIQGVLLNLYLLRLGFDTLFIGSLIASGQIIWALFALPAGFIGRRFGLRSALIAGSFLNMLGNSLLLMVEWLPKDMWSRWLYFAWILAWLGAALLTVNSIPYLMVISTPKERNNAFAAQGALMALLGFLGSVAAGFLPGVFSVWSGHSLDLPASYWYPLCLVPLTHLITIFIWIKSQPANLIEESDSLESVPAPLGLFVFFGIVVFLLTACEGSVRAFFNVYLDEALQMPTTFIGVIFGVGQLLPVFISLIIPGLLARWGSSLLLALSSAGAGLATLPLALFQHWIPATFGFVGLMVMLAINAPTRSIFSQEIVAPRWRTTTSAIATVGIGCGWASTAFAGGYLIPRVGFSGLFWIGTLLAFVAGILLWGFTRTRPNHNVV